MKIFENAKATLVAQTAEAITATLENGLQVQKEAAILQIMQWQADGPPFTTEGPALIWVQQHMFIADCGGAPQWSAFAHAVFGHMGLQQKKSGHY